MKAISLWQPWASLVADGRKRFETRSWATAYRGPLLICSTRDHPRWIWGVENPCLMPLGQALALVELTDCRRTEDVPMAELAKEWALGDFTNGRFVWTLEMIHRFHFPFPVHGRQRLFNIPDADVYYGWSQ